VVTGEASCMGSYLLNRKMEGNPKVWSIVATDGIDGFKYSKLHNRCISRLGKWVLADGCVYPNFVPVQDGIGLCDRRPGQ